MKGIGNLSVESRWELKFYIKKYIYIILDIDSEAVFFVYKCWTLSRRD